MKKIRLLVSEFITGGGLVDGMADSHVYERLPASLRLEGEMMLRSVVRDLSDLKNVEIWITRDPRIDNSGFPEEVRIKKIKGDYVAEFSRLCQQVDAVLPIAPESDGVLENLNRSVLASNKILLGSDPETVRVCASKSATATMLSKHHVPVVETVIAGSTLPDSANGWIVKPEQGVGSEQVFFTQSEHEVAELTATIKNAVVQPYIEGIPASLSLLCRGGECVVIGYNEQIIKRNEYHNQKLNLTNLDALRYEGTKVNSLTNFKPEFDQIATSVVQTFPGLSGYVGLDLIISEGKPVMLEINPRLTTSYSGLRESIGINPAALMLELLENKSLKDLQLSDQILSNPKVVEVLVPA